MTPPCQLVRPSTRKKSQSQKRPQSTSAQRDCLAEVAEQKAKRSSTEDYKGDEDSEAPRAWRDGYCGVRHRLYRAVLQL